MHVEVDRLDRARALDAARRRHRARARRRARRGRPTGRRWSRKAARDRRRARPAPAAGRRRTELAEARAFLEWLADNHFTFLGYRCHDLVGRGRRGRARRSSPARASASCASQAAEDARDELLAAAAGRSAPTRACRTCSSSPSRTSRSTVHRPGYLDYIGVKRFDDRGRGVRRAPLPRPVHVDRLQRAARPRFRSCAARSASVSRRARARAAAATPARRSRNILDDLSARRAVPDRARTSCCETAMGILHLGERQRFRLFVRRDPFERFLVVPHLRAARELHHRAAPEVAGDPDGGVQRHRARSSTCYLSESMLARIMITVRTTPGTDPGVRRARARGAARRRGAPLGRRSARTRSSTRSAKRAATSSTASSATAFPAAYREDFAARATPCPTSR